MALRLVTVVAAAIATLGATGPSIAKDGHGLNLDHPGSIDAVASILYPYQDQEAFTRVDDDTVLVELLPNAITQLRRMPERACAFQSRPLNGDGSVMQQYNFAQLTGEYRTISPGGTTNILFEGEGSWCDKDKNGLRCWNSIHVPVYGLNDSRKVMRAMAYLQQNFCPPAKPRRPF